MKDLKFLQFLVISTFLSKYLVYVPLTVLSENDKKKKVYSPLENVDQMSNLNIGFVFLLIPLIGICSS